MRSARLSPGTGTGSDLVALRGAGKRYRFGGPWVLTGVDLVVAPGSVAEANGPNGSGKSTLLRMLAGASVPTRGARLADARLRVGYAPDGLQTPPPMPARAYLRHHVRVRAARGGATAALGAEVAASAERLDAGALLEEQMPALSKGSLQKIVLIQALLGSPSLLVLDEPFAGLDAAAQTTLAELLAERREAGAAVVLSDHRPSGARVAADAIWRVGGGGVEVGSTPTGEWDRAPADKGAGGSERRRLRVAAAEVDAALRELLDDGWHIDRVAPDPEPGGSVAIEARRET